MRGQGGVEVLGGDVAAPEVVHGLVQQRRVVGQRRQRQRQPGGEGQLGQRALAEAVDGEDRGLVEALQRQPQALRQRGVVQAVRLVQVAQQRGHEGVAVVGVAALQHFQRLHHPGTDALAQFGGGGVGEGEHQDPRQLQAALQQQPQHQAADVPGLARAGRRLDQPDAVERGGEEVQGGEGHGALPRKHRRSGPKTVRAQRTNSSSSGSAQPRSASR